MLSPGPRLRLVAAVLAGALWWACAAAVSAAAGTVSVEYEFPRPHVVCAEADTYRVEMRGLPRWGAPGKPVLPYRTCYILLPPSSEVTSVRITAGERTRLPGRYVLEHGQTPVPLSKREPVARRPRDAGVYASTEWFPDRARSDWSVQRWRGHSILIVNLFPVRYLPAEGELEWSRYLTVDATVRLAGPLGAVGASSVRTPADTAYLSLSVDNPEALADYAAATELRALGSGLLEPDPAYDYVIITSEDLEAAGGDYILEDLVALKEAQGIAACIVTTEWVYSTYEGRRPDGRTDDQTRIRNFIIDAYTTWGTHYVLLAGDGDGADVGGESGDLIIPHRGFVGGDGYFTIDDDIPADMYYGCLDGSFDDDADGLYGEPTDGPGGGEVDLLAEVHVGRAPVDSAQEVSDFVAKQFAYHESVPSPQVWMVGERLGWGGLGEWGGNYKDEIRDGSEAHDYTTVGFLDSPLSPAYEVLTLYDRDDPENDWSSSALMDIINAGVHVINHLGHSGVAYVMKLVNAQIDLLRNTDLFIGYSQGCYPGAFDNRSVSGGYLAADCAAEHFVCGPYGAAAFIANSRYGWGVTYSTDGASQHFDREFWDAVLGEGIFRIGPANDDSKWDQAGYVALDPIGRFCCYELTVFGDPHLWIKLGLSSHGLVVFDDRVYPPEGPAGLMVMDLDLDADPSAPDEVIVEVVSMRETSPELVVCAETGASTGVFVGSISLAIGVPTPDGQLQVSSADTITAHYLDADDGSGGIDVIRSATALVDGVAPDFLGLQAAMPGDGFVSLAWLPAVDDSPPVRYNIYRADTPGGQDFRVPLVSTDQTSYQDDTVVNWRTYYYVVRAEDAVGREDANTVERAATPRHSETAVSYPLDSDPGWTCEGGWAFGEPMGWGSHDGDPTGGHTGANVYGYNLEGDYPNNLDPEYLTTSAIDCSALASVSLVFWRWLGVEMALFDHAGIEVSNDGAAWAPVWEHTGGNISDDGWVRCEYDISAVAAGQPTVYIRWRMGSTDGSVTYPGWNIDDVELRGVRDIDSRGAVYLDRPVYAADDEPLIAVCDGDLDLSALVPDVAAVEVVSTTETSPEVVSCIETGSDTGVFVGSLPLAYGTPSTDGTLQIAHGDTITVTYIDADDGSGGTGVLRTASARVDGLAPDFLGLQTITPAEEMITLAWSPATDDSPPVHYNIYRADMPGGQDFNSPLASTGQTSYLDDTVANWQTYYYVVRAEDSVGNEDTNTVEGAATPRGPEVIYNYSFYDDPGWTGEGGWAFGQPLGMGSASGDPTSGYTGGNVWGYNLAGDYESAMEAAYLTTTAIDCSALAAVSLRFWRWLGVERSSYDQAAVEASNDGVTWVTVWEHDGPDLCDASWVQCDYDVSALAAGQATVYLRWRMGPTDDFVTYPGWNIDDVEIWGVRGAASAGRVELDHSVYPADGSLAASVMDLDLNLDPRAADQVALQIVSTTEPGAETLVCTEMGDSTGVFAGSIPLASGTAEADGQLQVSHGDTITVTYIDADDGSGGIDVVRTASARVDGLPPDFLGLHAAMAGQSSVSLDWLAAADDSPPVHYNVYRAETPDGQDFSSSLAMTDQLGYRDLAVVNGTTYYYVVRAQDLAGNEETNTVQRYATPQRLELVYSYPLDDDPGWSCEGGWAFGEPTGEGSGSGDPTGGHTGTQVYGYNLSGDYESGMAAQYLSTTAIDCSGLSSVSLRFWRWLEVERSSYDEAAVEVSSDGATWVTVWEHSGPDLCDGKWISCDYDISAVAAGQATVYIRWRMGPTDDFVTYPGWNIDDIEIWGVSTEGGFLDLFPDHWAFDEIVACFRHGIVSGYPDSTYCPALPVARDQMAVYISRALAGGDAGVPPGPYVAHFPDVPRGHWAYDHIEYANTRNIVSGYRDGLYHPEYVLDRGQMAVFIARAICDPTGDAGLASYVAPHAPTFGDVSSDFWAYRYIEYLAAEGVAGGYEDGCYHPQHPVDRAQMAVFICRAFDLPM